MLLSNLQRLRHRVFDSASSLFGPVANDSQAGDVIDVQDLEVRLQAAHALAQPGFMTLRAVREGGEIVDFEWTSASVAATRLLAGTATDLSGKHLVELLAGCAGRGEVFNQYCRVVELGAARAVRQRVEINRSVNVLRHAAVRVHDGVAVTLTNLSALRREFALRREINARARMVARTNLAHA